jgi:pyruvate dehydrogenase E1 component
MDVLGASAPHLESEADSDPGETQEWLDALSGTVNQAGKERAVFLLRRLSEHASDIGLVDPHPSYSAYRNTISLEDQGRYPGDLAIEERLTAIIRWNALAMVVRANKAYGELGGHVASYASAAEIFEVGFNHFFRAADLTSAGDLVFFQPHSAPGVYARAFLEGRLDEQQLANFRQELSGAGLSSYPHPWLMPSFWQFPTGSMGIGPITSIYHARFMQYLEHRGIATTANRRVWGVFGDGEMDEPESLAGLTLAAREKLDNLTWIINCNLQRLDGPVRGNGQIIQELEALFTGAGWNVIKVLWGSEWDALFARDKSHALRPSTDNTRPSAPTTAPTTRRISSISIQSSTRSFRACRRKRSTGCGAAVTMSASSTRRWTPHARIAGVRRSYSPRRKKAMALRRPSRR